MAAVMLERDVFVPSADFAKRYELAELLGKGGFGRVYSCWNRRTGSKLACKVLSREYVRQALGVDPSKEVSIMEQLSKEHAGVIQLVDCVEDAEFTYIVMEHCFGGTLLDVLKRNGAMPERSARVVFSQLAAALAFCHSRRVIHLDVKPENVFFLDPPVQDLYRTSLLAPANLRGLYSSVEVRVRLADFGMATVLKAGKKVRGDVGSPHFKAPEIVAGKKFGLEVDVWSLGVVLCVMLTGSVPFLGTSNHDKEGLNKSILEGEVNFNAARWCGTSAQAKDLVCRMLQVDPKARISAADVLAHPWFRIPDQAPESEMLPTFLSEVPPVGKNLVKTRCSMSAKPPSLVLRNKCAMKPTTPKPVKLS